MNIELTPNQEKPRRSGAGARITKRQIITRSPKKIALQSSRLIAAAKIIDPRAEHLSLISIEVRSSDTSRQPPECRRGYVLKPAGTLIHVK